MTFFVKNGILWEVSVDISAQICVEDCRFESWDEKVVSFDLLAVKNSLPLDFLVFILFFVCVCVYARQRLQCTTDAGLVWFTVVLGNRSCDSTICFVNNSGWYYVFGVCSINLVLLLPCQGNRVVTEKISTPLHTWKWGFPVSALVFLEMAILPYQWKLQCYPYMRFEWWCWISYTKFGCSEFKDKYSWNFYFWMRKRKVLLCFFMRTKHFVVHVMFYATF